jgi:hypothetical protein
MRELRTRLALIGTFFLLAVLGCGPRDEDRVPVRGQVFFQGQPLPGGAVVFAPDTDRGTPNELAVGQIQPDGSYALKTDQGQDVAPGWYRVSIAATGDAVRLPDRYRDPLRSGLEREVVTGQANVANFSLE